MPSQTVDIAIIGAGTAGLGAYRAARKYTDSIRLIESGPHGTTCARVGCMPSKLLIAAAEHAHLAHHNGVFGVDYTPPHIDGRAVMDRVRRERDRFVGFVLESVASFPDDHKLRGHATFISPNELSIEREQMAPITINAKRIVIATGSSPHVPELLCPAGDRLLTNDHIFELETLPRSVAVFGPGVIGLELGQALARLGARVALFGRSGGLGIAQDPELRDYAIDYFNREFYLDPSASVSAVRRTQDGVEVDYVHRERGAITEQFDYLLAATGRHPNLANLNVTAAKLALDERGLPVHNRYTGQCGDSTIFIAGDVTDDLPLLHEAADAGRIAGDNAGRSLQQLADLRAGERRTPINILFSDPQMASVGRGYHALETHCANGYTTGQVSFENQGRARVINKNRGLLKVYGEHGTGLLLGAEMFGPAAEHIAHQLAWVIQMRMTVSQVLALPFYHPVIEEGVRTALRDLNERLQIGTASEQGCLDCGPGA
ncbi:dihydrolipoyl dehydrogenase [Simiduia aestuariiviva]|uniref:Dihydrolipoamide dehydrogenase n=1 Tax=Simiduia aestuariiviva TaxID=1510459 RepID=A0A839UT04_9GAMM|nr:dihydrolipoyl dehydrogenase [Simiduia aestuariiviva]MBB3169549.1 dihydrolipoamide dehydrogenase [Simiduia aestuariiviva]